MISDRDWLLQRKPEATEMEIDMFYARLSALLGHKHSNTHARNLALEAINHEYGA